MAEHPRYLLPFDTFALPHHLADVLVVGTGVAGLSAALGAADAGARVLVLSKGDPERSNTGWAQGGVAAVLGDDPEDSPALHAHDTVEVGQGLCTPSVVEFVCEEASGAIERLLTFGAQFDKTPDGAIARGLEGGHSAARILHARGDATGAEIRDCLARAVAEHPKIEVRGKRFVVDVLTDVEGRCRGALVLSPRGPSAVWARAVILATGGYAQMYRESTNVPGASGDGVAIAWRAGALVQDMEFIQFHPTTLYLAGVPRLLITEAIRGAGATIVDSRGVRFLEDIHPKAELAPRDVISRAIVKHLQQPEIDGVYLDLSHMEKADLEQRFPGVMASCQAHGLDVEHDRIPIRPAAHYSIGGIRTDAHGASSVPALYAAGEVSSTGLHGANRLASNSLLEGLVMGRRAGARAAGGEPAGGVTPERIQSAGTGARRGSIDIDDLQASLKALMWRDAGIMRTGAHLAGALGAVTGWEGFAHRVGSPEPRRLSLINMLCVARLATEAALRREESRGTHARRDFPERDDPLWAKRLLWRMGEREPLQKTVTPAEPRSELST